MEFNALSDADIAAISIVKEGANRKRFFLRKSIEGVNLDELITSPAESHRLIKSSDTDWSAVYCVVAEPGAFEDPGMGEQHLPDMWASEDEIRKACHRFAKNGALINKMHETLDEYGAMVENAVAIADFEVNGETIRKGSWYIAIEPNEHGRAEIEAGNFNGVSIQGTAMRTPMEKQATINGDDQAVATGEPIPAGSTEVLRSVEDVDEPETVLAKIRAIFTGEEPADEIAKTASFADRLKADQLSDELPGGLELLQDTIWSAVYNDDVDPIPVIRQSLTEFADWAESLLGSAEKVAKQRDVIGPLESTGELSTKEEEMITPEEKTELVDEITKGVAAELAKHLPSVDESEPTLESVSKALAEAEGLEGDALTERLAKAEEDIKKLGAGTSTQADESPEAQELKKTLVAKAYTDQGVDPRLSEVL